MSNEMQPVGMSFECDELAKVGLSAVESGSVDEALDRPFFARIELEVGLEELDVEPLVGADATLRMSRVTHGRDFHGLITEIAVLGNSPGKLLVEVHLEPAFRLLALGQDSRIYQGLTVPEIVADVFTRRLAPYGREHRSEVTREYPKREYCVQYRESDFDFVCRLLEEEGIAYHFDHEGERETIVLTDTNTKRPKIASFPAPGLLGMITQGNTPTPDVLDREGATRFRSRYRHSTTTHVARDANFTRAGLFLEAKDGAADRRGRERIDYRHGAPGSVTIWDYASGSRRYQSTDVERQVKIRGERAKLEQVYYNGASTTLGMAAGSRFLLSGAGSELDGEYLLTRVGHSTHGLGMTDGYHNTFECIRDEEEHRPARDTPKPRISSVQTALVTGPSGEEIHVDEYGRVKVQLYWDREGKLDEKSSCWVRTQQAWAGNGFGTWWVPRVGMEVIVQFVDGDPDRPLVTGCVYNADNQLPYAMPDEKTRSTIKSNSTTGGGGFNEFRFEDKKGSEEIWLHAQKDWNEKVVNDHTIDVGKDETITIKANQSIEVGGNRTDTVAGDETRSVNGAVQEKIVAGQTQTITGGNTQSISGGNTQSISGGNSLTVTGGSSSNVSGGSKSNVTGGKNEKVSGGLSQEVIGGIKEQVLGDVKKMITGMIDEVVSAKIKQVTPTVERLESESTDTSSKKTWLTDVEYGVTMAKAELNVTQLETWGVKGEGGGVLLGAFGLKRDVEALKSETSGVTTTGSGLEVNMDGCRIIT